MCCCKCQVSTTEYLTPACLLRALVSCRRDVNSAPTLRCWFDEIAWLLWTDVFGPRTMFYLQDSMLWRRAQTTGGCRQQPHHEEIRISRRHSEGSCMHSATVDQDHASRLDGRNQNCRDSGGVVHSSEETVSAGSCELSTYALSRGGELSNMTSVDSLQAKDAANSSIRGTVRFSLGACKTGRLYSSLTHCETRGNTPEQHGWIGDNQNRPTSFQASSDFGHDFQHTQSCPAEILRNSTVNFDSCTGYDHFRDNYTGPHMQFGDSISGLHITRPHATLEDLTDPEVLAMLSRARPDLRSAVLSVLQGLAVVRARAAQADIELGFDGDLQHPARRASSRSVFSRLGSTTSRAGEHSVGSTSSWSFGTSGCGGGCTSSQGRHQPMPDAVAFVCVAGRHSDSTQRRPCANSRFTQSKNGAKEGLVPQESIPEVCKCK